MPCETRSGYEQAGDERRQVPRPIRIGTRGSALAMAQARTVEAALAAHGIPVELVTIVTEGDRRAPDTAWGEGAFVAAIERALLDGTVDVAVHSAKDVPTRIDERLVIAAYLEREDPRDVLVVRGGIDARSLADLPAGCRVGTDSPRRTGFLLAARPDLRPHPLHGNVDTRLRRLDDGATDALVLALAGLRRLGREDRVSHVLSPEVVPPAPGQGAIALQARADDDWVLAAVRPVDHLPTRVAVEAERAFLAASGGGCRAPIGALARADATHLTLRGAFVRADGSDMARGAAHGPAGDGTAVAQRLARRLGRRLPGLALDEGSDGGPDSAPERGLELSGPSLRTSRPRALVTRPAEHVDELHAALRKLGIEPVAVPAIAIEHVDPAQLRDVLEGTPKRAWIVVTSPNGALAAARAISGMRGLGHDLRWAAVGPETRRRLESAGIAVEHVASKPEARVLAEELPVEPGVRVTLVRGNLADPSIAARLRARGAEVREVVAYRTLEAPEPSRALLRKALDAGRVAAIVFTSGSTIRGLLALADADQSSRLRALLAICIGPRTTNSARAAGFRRVSRATGTEPSRLAAAVATALNDRESAEPAPDASISAPAAASARATLSHASASRDPELP